MAGRPRTSTGLGAGFWRLMEIFRSHQVKATFFACGMALEQSPAAAREITGQGHEVSGHGYRWRPSYEMSLEEERADIRRAVEAIEEATGQRPVGWNSRAPGVHTRELLVEHGGFIYDSDSYGDDLPYFVEVDGRRFLTIPYSLETNDERFLPAPTVTGFASPHDFFDVLKDTFDNSYTEGANPSEDDVGGDCTCASRVGRPGPGRWTGSSGTPRASPASGSPAASTSPAGGWSTSVASKRK